MPTTVFSQRIQYHSARLHAVGHSAAIMATLIVSTMCSVVRAQDDIADRIRRAAPVTPAPPLRDDTDDADSSVPSVSAALGEPQSPTSASNRSAGSEPQPMPASPESAQGVESSGEAGNQRRDSDQRRSNSAQRAPMGTQSSVQLRPVFPRISRMRDRWHARPRRVRKVLRGVCGIPSIAARLDKKGGCWDRDFWGAWGIYANSHGTAGAGANAPLRFNDLALEPALHQLGFSVRRQPDYLADGLGWGFGLDMFFGADGPDAQVGSSPLQLTVDNEWDNTWDTSSRYGLAIPQFYLETAWNRWAVRYGRFFSIFGYEKVPAHQNFFYSHSYAFNYNQPLSQWGVMVRRQWTPNLVSYTGRATGWETSLQNDDNDGGATFGGFDFTPVDWIKLHGALTWGDPGDLDTGETDFYMHEAYAQIGLTDTIDYVLAHTFQTRTRPVGTTPVHSFKLYGFTNYLYWYLNDLFTVGARYEWLYAGEGTGSALSPIVITPGTHFHAITFGANLHLMKRMILRPEVRYDWVDFDGGVAGGPFDNGTARSQFTYGMQSVIVW